MSGLAWVWRQIMSRLNRCDCGRRDWEAIDCEHVECQRCHRTYMAVPS